MLLYKSRLISSLRCFSSQQKKTLDESDDEKIFQNIESVHKTRVIYPFRRFIHYVIRLIISGGVSIFVYTFYQYKSSKGPNAEPLDFPEVGSMIQGYRKTTHNFRSLFIDPPLDKLLPDLPKLPAGYMQPKTLVLDLKGTLLSSEYIFGQGFVIMKRPGLTEFLNKVSQMYEVVIFCEEETMFMSQLVESLDPNHRIFQARMGKECLSYRGGELTKDMRFLNRDMKNLIIIEKNPKMVKLHSDNVILLPEFQGNENDRALIEILPFLEHLVKDKIPDVRKEIERYGHVDTGKKYLGRLEKIRDGILKKQQTGFNRFLTKRPTAPQQETEAITSSSPKPTV